MDRGCLVLKANIENKDHGGNLWNYVTNKLTKTKSFSFCCFQKDFLHTVVGIFGSQSASSRAKTQSSWAPSAAKYSGVSPAYKQMLYEFSK